MTTTAQTVAIPTHSWSMVETLSQQIYRAADNEEWQQVLELATQRHEQLTSHFAQFPVGPDNALFYYEHLPALLVSEQRLQATTLAARKAVMRDGLTSSRTQRAIGNYLNQ